MIHWNSVPTVLTTTTVYLGQVGLENKERGGVTFAVAQDTKGGKLVTFRIFLRLSFAKLNQKDSRTLTRIDL